MKNKQIAILLTILMGAAPLAGCFGANEITETADEDGGFFAFEQGLNPTTWYHYPGGINAMNNTKPLPP